MTTAELAAKTFVPDNLIIRDKEHIPLSADEIKSAIAEAFAFLYERYGAKKLTLSTIVYLGVAIDTTVRTLHLIPSINGQSFPHLKCEFTGFLGQKFEVAIPRKGKASTLAKVGGKVDECFAVLAQDATLKIESIGARGGTNWDTGYTLEIRRVPTEDIRDFFATHESMLIESSAKANGSRTTGFMLSTKAEVKRFMELANLGKIFNEIVKTVKRFEDENDLKARQTDNGGTLKGYRKNSLTHVLRLANAA